MDGRAHIFFSRRLGREQPGAGHRGQLSPCHPLAPPMRNTYKKSRKKVQCQSSVYAENTVREKSARAKETQKTGVSGQQRRQ